MKKRTDIQCNPVVKPKPKELTKRQHTPPQESQALLKNPSCHFCSNRRYILYRSEYKYQLAENYCHHTEIRPPSTIDSDFITLDTSGYLLIKKGYAWDGPSGPVIDTKENMRASLVHDALYQLMRTEKLYARKFRKSADLLFRDICKEDGVSNIRATTYYKALRKFGKPAATPLKKKIIYRSPKP